MSQRDQEREGRFNNPWGRDDPPSDRGAEHHAQNERGGASYRGEQQHDQSLGGSRSGAGSNYGDWRGQRSERDDRMGDYDTGGADRFSGTGASAYDDSQGGGWGGPQHTQYAPFGGGQQGGFGRGASEGQQGQFAPRYRPQGDLRGQDSGRDRASSGAQGHSGGGGGYGRESEYGGYGNQGGSGRWGEQGFGGRASQEPGRHAGRRGEHDEGRRDPYGPSQGGGSFGGAAYGAQGGYGSSSRSGQSGDWAGQYAGGSSSHAGPERHHDPDYDQWRAEQLRNLDEDYKTWRQERYQKFSEEFNQWRSQRPGRSGLRSESPGLSGMQGSDTTGGVDTRGISGPSAASGAATSSTPGSAPGSTGSLGTEASADADSDAGSKNK